MAQIQSIGVVGSGQMGGGIAQVAAQSGYSVTLADISLAAATSGKQKIEKALNKLVEKGKMEAARSAEILGLITPVGELAGLANCDVVMTSIGPLRRSPRIRRSGKTAAEILDELEGRAEADATNLPVPVSPARTIPPKAPVASAAQIEAQLIGERRGLRAGSAVIDAAKHTYNRVEWSGGKDRRAPKGKAAKTDV